MVIAIVIAVVISVDTLDIDGLVHCRLLPFMEQRIAGNFISRLCDFPGCIQGNWCRETRGRATRRSQDDLWASPVKMVSMIFHLPPCLRWLKSSDFHIKKKHRFQAKSGGIFSVILRWMVAQRSSGYLMDSLWFFLDMVKWKITTFFSRKYIIYFYGPLKTIAMLHYQRVSL